VSAELFNYVALFRLPGGHPLATPGGFQCMAEDIGHAEEQCKDAYPGCDVVWAWVGPAGVGMGPALADYYAATEMLPDNSAETPIVRPKCPHCGSLKLRAVDRVTITTNVLQWALSATDGLYPVEYGDNTTTHWDSCMPADPKPYECEACLSGWSAADLRATLP
jgi:hypothetical protein